MDSKTAFDHTMDSIDYAKTHNYSLDVFLSSLCHDTGKGVSKKAPVGEEQHHYGHEIFSYIINKRFVQQHRFTSNQNELIVLFARHHMYFHQLEKIKNPIKLVRFYKTIKNKVDEMILAANTDHPLNDNQLMILNNLKRTFKETVIDIPKSILAKGKESTVNFVLNQYVVKYKEIISE